MRAILVALALLVGAPTLALARPPMETSQLVDGDGVPIGTPANPIAVTGGGGGGSSAPDGAATTYTVTGTGDQPGLPLSGYGSVFVEARGGTATHVLLFSVDSTDGLNGTWTTGFGYLSDNNGGSAPSSAIDSLNNRRKLFRGQDGLWVRLSTTSFTTGPVSVTLARRIPSISERGVAVGIGAGTNVIGSTTLRATGTNRSATVGTTATTLMPANAARQGWKIKNDSTGDVWINFDATATAAAGGGNIKVPVGGYLASEPGFVETGAMSVVGSAAGLTITVREH